jgi:hypothetical protein
MSKPNFVLCWKEECNFELSFSTCVTGIMPVVLMMPTNSVSGIEQERILSALWGVKLICILYLKVYSVPERTLLILGNRW